MFFTDRSADITLAGRGAFVHGNLFHSTALLWLSTNLFILMPESAQL